MFTIVSIWSFPVQRHHLQVIVNAGESYLKSLHDKVVTFFVMIFYTFGTVFESADKFRISAAVGKEIEWAETEQTVLVIKPVAWIIFADLIRKVFITQQCPPVYRHSINFSINLIICDKRWALSEYYIIVKQKVYCLNPRSQSLSFSFLKSSDFWSSLRVSAAVSRAAFVSSAFIIFAILTALRL